LLHQRAHLGARGREPLAGSRIRSTLDHGGHAGCKRQAIELSPHLYRLNR
jgi:hypothetical protein